MWFGWREELEPETTPLHKELYEELPSPIGEEEGSLRTGRGGFGREFWRWPDVVLGLGAFVLTLYALTYVHPGVLIRPVESSRDVASSSSSSSSSYPLSTAANKPSKDKYRPQIHFITYGTTHLLHLPIPQLLLLLFSLPI